MWVPDACGGVCAEALGSKLEGALTVGVLPSVCVPLAKSNVLTSLRSDAGGTPSSRPTRGGRGGVTGRVEKPRSQEAG